MPAKLTQDQILTSFKAVHGDTYDYSKVIYTTNKKCVTITCKIHGDFQQRPRNHTVGEGCPICGKSKQLTKQQERKVSTSKFISRSTATHGARYDYSKSIVNGTRSKPIIICEKHGEFSQRVDLHIAGKGCPKCGRDLKAFSYSEWETLGLQSKNFDSFKVYLLECKSDTEHFLKIGKTFTTVAKRYPYMDAMPYKWKLLEQFEADALSVSTLEMQIKQLDITKYLPTNYFSGSITECFHTDTLNTILAYIKGYQL